MDDNLRDTVICVLVVLLLIKLMPRGPGQRDRLTARPSASQRGAMAGQIMKHRELFRQGGLTLAKEEMPWMDALVYEDVRGLERRGGMTLTRVQGVLK
jgi:hypothetical protein